MRDHGTEKKGRKIWIKIHHCIFYSCEKSGFLLVQRSANNVNGNLFLYKKRRQGIYFRTENEIKRTKNQVGAIEQHEGICLA